MSRMEIDLAVRGIESLDQAAAAAARLSGAGEVLEKVPGQAQRATNAWREYTRELREATRATEELKRAQQGLGPKGPTNQLPPGPPATAGDRQARQDLAPRRERDLEPAAARQSEEATAFSRGLEPIPARQAREAAAVPAPRQDADLEPVPARTSPAARSQTVERDLGLTSPPKAEAGEPGIAVSGPAMSAREIARLKKQMADQGFSEELIGQTLAAAPRAEELPKTIPVRGVERQRAKADGLEEPPSEAVRIPIGPEQRVPKLEQTLAAARERGLEPEIRDTEGALARQRALRERQRQREDGLEPAPEAPAGPAQKAEHLRGLQPAIEATGTDAEKADLRAALARAEEQARRQELPPAPRALPTGAFQRLDDLKTRGLEVESRGTDAEKKDYALAMRSAERSASRAGEQLDGKPLEKRLLELIGTTRLGFGAHGFQPAPLLNRVGMLFSEGEAGAGLAGGATGALAGAGIGVGLGLSAAALREFTEAVKGAAARANELRSAGMESGGTPGEVARLTALGLPAGQVSGAAAAFRERISLTGSNPFALMAAGRAGIEPQMPAEFGGNQDNARGLVQALDYLHQLQGSEQQLAEARRLGLESTLPLVNVSNRLWDAEKRLVEQQGSLFGTDLQRDAAELAGESRRLQEEWGLLEGRFAAPFLRVFADDLHDLNDLLEKGGPFMKDFAEGTRHLLNTLRPFARQDLAPGEKSQKQEWENLGYRMGHAIRHDLKALGIPVPTMRETDAGKRAGLERLPAGPASARDDAARAGLKREPLDLETFDLQPFKRDGLGRSESDLQRLTDHALAKTGEPKDKATEKLTTALLELAAVMKDRKSVRDSDRTLPQHALDAAAQGFVNAHALRSGRVVF